MMNMTTTAMMTPGLVIIDDVTEIIMKAAADIGPGVENVPDITTTTTTTTMRIASFEEAAVVVGAEGGDVVDLEVWMMGREDPGDNSA